MNIFNFLESKTTTRVRFEKDPPGKCITLETPEGVLESFGADELCECVRRIIEDPNFHMILTLPEATSGVRFIQACELNGTAHIEVAIEKKDYVQLVAREFTPQECLDIFIKFYETGVVDNLRRYRPMRFKRNPSQP